MLAIDNRNFNSETSHILFFFRCGWSNHFQKSKTKIVSLKKIFNYSSRFGMVRTSQGKYLISSRKKTSYFLWNISATIVTKGSQFFPLTITSPSRYTELTKVNGLLWKLTRQKDLPLINFKNLTLRDVYSQIYLSQIQMPFWTIIWENVLRVQQWKSFGHNNTRVEMAKVSPCA